MMITDKNLHFSTEEIQIHESSDNTQSICLTPVNNTEESSFIKALDFTATPSASFMDKSPSLDSCKLLSMNNSNESKPPVIRILALNSPLPTSIKVALNSPLPTSTKVAPQGHVENVPKLAITEKLNFMIRVYVCLFSQFFLSLCSTLAFSLQTRHLQSNSSLLTLFIVSLSILLLVLLSVLCFSRYLVNKAVQILIYLTCLACFVLIFLYLELVFKDFKVVSFLAMFDIVCLIHVAYWLWKRNESIINHIRLVLFAIVVAFACVACALYQIIVSVIVGALVLLVFFCYAVFEVNVLGDGRFGLQCDDYFIASQLVYVEIIGVVYSVAVSVCKKLSSG